MLSATSRGLACLFSLCAALASAQAQPLPAAPTRITLEVLANAGPPSTYAPISEIALSYGAGVVAEIVWRLPTPGADASFTDVERVTYDYDADRTSSTHWHRDSTGWTAGARGHTSYTLSGVATSALREEYDPDADVWRNATRTTSTFSGDGPTAYEEEEWTGTGWRPVNRTLFSASAAGTEIVHQVWMGGTWVNRSRWHYPSLTPGEVAHMQAELGGPERVLHASVPSRRIAELTYATAYTKEDWASSRQQWIPAEQTQVETHTEDSVVVFRHEWNSAGAQLTTRRTLRFDEDLLTEVLNGAVMGDAFHLTSRQVYTYADGVPVLVEDFEGEALRDGIPGRRTVLGYGGLIGGVGVEGETGTPSLARVTAVQPNPATHSAAVLFQLDAPAHARVSLFDALGRQVATLADGLHEAGPHTARVDASALPAGLYLVRLEAGGRAHTHALVIAR